MSQFIESVKRLYRAKLVSYAKVTELYDNGTITEEEKKYIFD